jgi:hypothetical protein
MPKSHMTGISAMGPKADEGEKAAQLRGAFAEIRTGS